MTVLADLPRDFRYAARSLLRAPSFNVVAVAVLARSRRHAAPRA
jgi:hypothetical protein